MPSLSRISTLFALCALLPFQVTAQTAVSDAVFKDLVRFASYAGASYADVCDEPPAGSEVVQYFDDAASDTQATLFKDDKTKELVLSFRGTSTPRDFETDLDFLLVPLIAAGTDCGHCKVHSGFQKSYNALSSDIASVVESNSAGYDFIITGHSLGGGIAAIAASSLVASGINVTRVITYGEPRNGDNNWVNYISDQVPPANYFRVTNANDGVPQIPPRLLGYSHHGNEYWFSKPSGNTAATTYKCDVETNACNQGEDFGENPINLGHLTYGNSVIGNSLFVLGCGAQVGE